MRRKIVRKIQPQNTQNKTANANLRAQQNKRPATPKQETRLLDTPPSVTEVVPVSYWKDSLGHLATRVAQTLIILIGVAIIVFTLVQLNIVVIPILIALIIASAAQPLIKFMERHKFSRPIATIITMLTGVILIGGVGALIVFNIKGQWSVLTEAINKGVKQITNLITSGSLPIDKDIIDELTQNANDFITSSQFGSGALAGVTGIFELIAGFILTIVILFFFIKDGPIIWHFLLSFFKPVIKNKMERVGEYSVKVLGGYVNGTALVALLDAVVIGIALWILNVPLALPLAIIVFISAFIPIVGATLAGVISALVALVTVDLHTAIIVTIIVIAVNQLEGHLLAPVVLGNALKLHALVIIFALSTGAILGGIIGTFLAVPIAAVLWATIKAWKEPELTLIKRTKKA